MSCQILTAQLGPLEDEQNHECNQAKLECNAGCIPRMVQLRVFTRFCSQGCNILLVMKSTIIIRNFGIKVAGGVTSVHDHIHTLRIKILQRFGAFARLRNFIPMFAVPKAWSTVPIKTKSDKTGNMT